MTTNTPDPRSGTALFTFLQIDEETNIEDNRIILPTHPDEIRRHLKIFLTENLADDDLFTDLTIRQLNSETYLVRYMLNGKLGICIFTRSFETAEFAQFTTGPQLS